MRDSGQNDDSLTNVERGTGNAERGSSLIVAPLLRRAGTRMPKVISAKGGTS
jgi:hypothetical protein